MFLCTVLQVELLQSQNEVKRLSDRVTEASRDKAEMVSSKVHTQLIQIADEKAMAAEMRTQELEKEVSLGEGGEGVHVAEVLVVFCRSVTLWVSGNRGEKGECTSFLKFPLTLEYIHRYVDRF